MNNKIYLLRIATQMAMRKQVTFKKVLNLMGALWNYWGKKSSISTYPIALVLDPLEACNLSCYMCPVGVRPKSTPAPRLGLDQFKRLIDEIKDYLAILIPYVNGEPFLHPDFLEMIEYASRNKIHILASTNGHIAGNTEASAERLVRSGLDHLVVTISGISQDIYSRYHQNGNIEKVLSNVKRIVDAKKRLGSSTPYLLIRYIKFSYNLHEIEKARQLAGEIGVDEIVFREARQVYSDDENSIYDAKRLEEYKNNYIPDYRQVTAAQKEAARCSWPWFIAVVNANGFMPVCTQYSVIPDAQSENKIDEYCDPKSFKDVWTGSAFTAVRKSFADGVYALSYCRDCKRGIGFGDDV
jgi:MoaA/NifB/PqqE/SkfB family radical SAM enzyme